MSSQLKPFSFMGVPNSEMFPSDKDGAMEFSVLVRPPLEFQIAPFQDESQQQKQVEDKCELMRLSVGGLKVDEENDGFKTPTRSNHRIPAILKCPPAPRKPKTTKRKAIRTRSILLDLTKEIESLFPPALLADLGNKIKKVRQASDFK